MASVYKDHVAWLFEEPWLLLIFVIIPLFLLFTWWVNKKQPPESRLTNEEFLEENKRLYPELFEGDEEGEETLLTEPTPEELEAVARQFEDLARKYDERGMPQDAARMRALATVNRGYEGAMKNFYATFPGPESIPEDPRWLRIGLALTRWARPREERGP